MDKGQIMALVLGIVLVVSLIQALQLSGLAGMIKGAGAVASTATGVASTQSASAQKTVPTSSASQVGGC